MSNNKLILHSYQRQVVDEIKTKKRLYIPLWMGAGKTIATLTAISELINEQKIKTVLIVAPLSVSQFVWPKEITKFTEFNHLSYVNCIGLSKTRYEIIKQEVNILIINYDLLLWLISVKHNKFDFIVFDESVALKSNGSKRFQAAKMLQAEYIIALTGTPSPNGLLDLWSQYFLLDRGKALGKNFTTYKNSYFYPTDYMQYKWEPLNPAVIYQNINHLTFAVSEQPKNLPDITYLNTMVELPSIREYKNFAKDLILELDSHTITAQNAGVLTNKLLQYTSGAIYTQDNSTAYHVIHNRKLEALTTLIENNSGENFLIVYNFKSDLQRLQKYFPSAIVLTSQDDKTIDRWNDKKIKLLLCHPASCSQGLNLQFGGRIIVWFSLTWNLEHYLQMNKRLHRQGQKSNVIINHLIANDSIDSIVLEALTNKEQVQNHLLSYFRQNNETI